MNLTIKIKGTNESFVVAIDTNERSYGALLEIIATELEKLCPLQLLRFKFKMSLNGKTPIEAASDDVSMASVGIVTGDVLHLLAEQQIVNIINGENPCKKVSLKSDFYSGCKLSKENFVERHLNEVKLIREIEEEKFPKNLIEEFDKSPVSNDFQALLVIFKVLMKEEGFRIKKTTVEKNSSVTMEFIFKDFNTSCKLVINLFGDKIIVNGFYSTHFCFSSVHIPTFIRRKPHQINFSLLIYYNLPALSRQFKNDIVLPLIAEINYDLGILNPLQIDNLPVIILIKIFKLLDHKDLCRFSTTCSTLNRLGNDNLLWKRLFKIKGLKDPMVYFDDDEMDWKMKYREHYKNAEKAAEKIQKLRYAREYRLTRRRPRLINVQPIFPNERDEANRLFFPNEIEQYLYG